MRTSASNARFVPHSALTPSASDGRSIQPTSGISWIIGLMPQTRGSAARRSICAAAVRASRSTQPTTPATNGVSRAIERM